jgi:hypothetical protein
VLEGDERRRVVVVQGKATRRCYVAKIYQDPRLLAHEKTIMERLCGCLGVPTLAGVSETDTHRLVLLTDDTGGRDLTTHIKHSERFTVRASCLLPLASFSLFLSSFLFLLFHLLFLVFK